MTELLQFGMPNVDSVDVIIGTEGGPIESIARFSTWEKAIAYARSQAAGRPFRSIDVLNEKARRCAKLVGDSLVVSDISGPDEKSITWPPKISRIKVPKGLYEH